MAGFFMHIKRNPVSILATLKLTPFPSIYAFSEAFDLYFYLSAHRTSKEKSNEYVMGNVPSLIVQPLSLSRQFPDYRGKDRKSETYILNHTGGWTEASTRYEERKGVEVSEWKGAAKAPLGHAYQSFKPHKDQTSISEFYDTKFKAKGMDVETGFSAPSDAAIYANRGYASFPLAAMYVRMLDQYGIELKNQLAARLREIKVDRPDSLAEHQAALMSVLDGK